ncbi:hypothetical protein CE91St28_22460 [Pyramidobacter piscolens]|nr:hypothetical protein CE91St28_22460 [Pyramidobacter piscolens]
MVRTMELVGVTLVIKSAVQIKNTKRIALANPLKIPVAVTGRCWPGNK